MDNRPDIGKEMMKRLLTMLSMRITGQKPKSIDLEDKMSVDEDGDLEDKTDINIELSDGGIIQGEATHIDASDPEEMKKFLEKLHKKSEKEQKKLEKEYDKWLNDHFHRMNLIPEFKEQFPEVNEFGGAVLCWVDDVNADDFIWLCSELKHLEQILDDDVLNNYRICRTQLDELTENYRQAKRNGCCKAFDHIVVNPKTGNKFSIGCNYNHERPELEFE